MLALSTPIISDSVKAASDTAAGHKWSSYEDSLTCQTLPSVQEKAPSRLIQSSFTVCPCLPFSLQLLSHSASTPPLCTHIVVSSSRPR